MPGGDCAGTVVAVGEGVSHLVAGDAVFGIAGGSLRSYVTGNALLLARPTPCTPHPLLTPPLPVNPLYMPHWT